MLAVENAQNALRSGNRQEAANCYSGILRKDPDCLQALLGLGELMLSGNAKQATELFQRAASSHPESSQAFYNLGRSSAKGGDLREAIRCFQKALSLDRKFAFAYSESAKAHGLLGEFSAAEKLIKRALKLNPKAAAVLWNLARVKCWQGQQSQGFSIYQKMLEQSPEDPTLQGVVGMYELLFGEFESGWKRYESRFKLAKVKTPTLEKSRLWDGGDLNGKNLCLLHEQGWGDTIQFARYANYLKEAYPNVQLTLRCPKKLISLLSTLESVDHFEAKEEPTEQGFDFYAPLLSLPLKCEHFDSEQLPAPTRYLQSRKEKAEHWSRVLERTTQFEKKRVLKIGLAWQGNRKHPDDARRSTPLRAFLSLAKWANVEFYSLQKGFGEDQIGSVQPWMKIRSFEEDFDEGESAFEDTAAVIENLDLVICCDSAVAHLSGALGAKTWVALCADPDWRWLLDREDSPWYPSMRLFRQSTPGSWESVFEEMAATLVAEFPFLEASPPDRFRLATGPTQNLVAARHGLFTYNKHDVYIGKALENYGEWSEGEVEIFKQFLRPGAHAIEVGSNIGTHTVPISSMVGEYGKVYAFEPQGAVYQNLCANLTLNSCLNVEAGCYAIGDSTDCLQIPKLRYDRANNFGGVSLGEEGNGTSVGQKPLDQLGIQKCELLKIDAEGMELKVLLGAENTVKNCKPIIYLENDRQDRSEQVLSWLLDREYRLYWHIVPLFSGQNFFRNQENVFGNVRSVNVLCIPKQFNVTIQGLREITKSIDWWK